jgi:two-component system CheB/CheR fusion protein
MRDQLENIKYAVNEKLLVAVNEKLLVLDTNLRVINASPAFYKAFKVGPAETLDRQLKDLGDGQWNLPALLKQLKELPPTHGEFDGFEVQHNFPGLGPKTMLLSARKLSSEGNGDGTILLAIDDVTGHRNTNAELAQQRAQFETALSSIADAVIVTDAESIITLMNPTAEKLTGWPQKEALKRPLEDVFSIVDERLHKPIEGPVPRAIREGPITGLAGLTILVARDGTQRPIEDSATPIRDNMGKIIGVVLIFRATSKRRRIEKRMEISEVRYRRLFETAHDGILILDAQTAKVLDVNRFMINLLRYPIEHFLGKELWEIGVFHDALASKTAMFALQEKGNIRYEGLPLEDKNGKHIPVEFVSNVYSEGDHNVIQCNIRDITERRRVAEELHKAKTEAEAANRAKSEFLANMSHEIRTPMTAIMGFADMILQPDQNDAGRTECVQVIRRNGTYLLELINGILDLSKIEEGRMSIESIPSELTALLADMVGNARPRAAEKGLEFELIIACPIPRFVRTDPLRLRQIMANLLGNAIKFTTAGKVAITICSAGTEPAHVLRFEVSDTGIGMTPEQIERLFRPFSQADESITRKFGGTGLGLTISRQLARLLGGEIEVKSKLGAGSTFTLRVDVGSLAGVEMLADLNEAMLPAPAPTDKWQNIPLHGRILLAEDGRDNQRLISMHLRACGAEVVIAENGQVAVDIAMKNSLDLILMDMQMPIMDGYTATAELRRRGCKTPIIALTAYAMAEDRKRCMATGCTDYLSKPIDREVLLKTISQHLLNAASPPVPEACGDAKTSSPAPAFAATAAVPSAPVAKTAPAPSAVAKSSAAIAKATAELSAVVAKTAAPPSATVAKTAIPPSATIPKTPSVPSAAIAKGASGPITSSLAARPGMMTVITEFVDGLPAEVQKISDSLEHNDMGSLRRIIHQLRGAAGGYGFDPITIPATKAEELIDASGSLAEVTVKINSLIDVVRRIDGYGERKATAETAGSP